LLRDESRVVLSDVAVVDHQVRDFSLSLLKITGPAEIRDREGI
jgi:hypothetical protein